MHFIESEAKLKNKARLAVAFPAFLICFNVRESAWSLKEFAGA